jgi:hypothetical protein
MSDVTTYRLDAYEKRADTADARMQRIEAKIDTVIEHLTDMRVELSGLRGRVEMMPSTWQMLIAIVGGQVGLAGLMAAVVFGAAHLTGKL